MLAQETLVSFLATSDSARSRAFYEGALGLTLIGDHEHMMTFQSGASRVALQKGVEVNPRGGTSMGWNVADIRATIRDLVGKGVVFERYEGMEQDDLGVWAPMPGAGVAWFKDPDGNLLSLSQGA
jgi:catechol 2,3-dioxygenase-like lactoylglutathione lyase family enzyme